MRSKTEARRCGCGAILSLREGCKRCADQARARLHAGGVAKAERPGQPYDNGLFGIRPSSGPLRGVRWEDAHQRLLKKEYPPMRLTLPSGAICEVTPAPGVDVAGFFIGIDPGCHDTAVAVTSRRRADGAMEVVDVQRLAKHEPPPVGAEVSRASDQRCRCVECRFERMEITTGERGWYRATGRCLEACTKRHTPTDGAPPAIGEEVAWERALADMKVRREARYDYRILNMRAVGTEYAWVGFAVVTRRSSGFGWTPTCLTEAECADPERRWVRLA